MMKCASAFQFVVRKANSRTSFSSSTTTPLFSSQQRRRPYSYHNEDDMVSFGGYDHEPDMADWEEIMRQEQQQQKPSLPKVTCAITTTASFSVIKNPSRSTTTTNPTTRSSSLPAVTSIPSSLSEPPPQPIPFQNRTDLPVYDFFTCQDEVQQPQSPTPVGPVDVFEFLYELGAQMSKDANDSQETTTTNAVEPAPAFPKGPTLPTMARRPPLITANPPVVTSKTPPVVIPNPSIMTRKPPTVIPNPPSTDGTLISPTVTHSHPPAVTDNSPTVTLNTFPPATPLNPPSLTGDSPTVTLNTFPPTVTGNTFPTAALNTPVALNSRTFRPPVTSISPPPAVTSNPPFVTGDSPPPAYPTAYLDVAPTPAPPRPRPPPPPSAGSGITATTRSVECLLEVGLTQITQQIYQQNNHEPFNINSFNQVSIAVFGVPGESTHKEALEAKAATGNRMADLILQYRRLQQTIRRQVSKEKAVQQGTRVTSAAQSTTTLTTDPLLLVDASAYIYRAYYSMPPIHRSDGMPTGAVMGFCNMLNRLVLNRMMQGEQPRIVLVFDAKGKTFRHSMYNLYKANRAEAPMDLIPQFSLIRQAGLAYGMPMLEAQNYEADDVIATLAGMAQREGLDTHILSGDKDLMQLIRDDGPTVVHMIDPMKMERVTTAQVVEKWLVPPEQLGDVLALAGDAADNVPGVPGIGPKIAADLLREFGSLEYLLDHVDQVPQPARRSKLEAFADQARLSKALVTLVDDIPMDSMTFSEGQHLVSDLRMEPMNEKRILSFYDAMNFRDLKQRFVARLEGVQRIKKQAPNPRRYNVSSNVSKIPTLDDFRDVPF